MLVRADFSRRAIVAPGDHEWVPSPQPGIERVMLDRQGVENGATLFVKLWQLYPQDTRRVRVNTRDPSAWRRQGNRDTCALFSGFWEEVSLHRVPPSGRVLAGRPANGAEILVLAGDVRLDSVSCGKGG